MTYLSKSEMFEYISSYPLSAGEQTHVNHENCPAGTDRKKRLYIKHMPDGGYLFYCHHCGYSGFYKEKVANVYRVVKQPLTDKPSAKDLRLPKDVLKDTTRWSLDARGWLLKYGVTEQEIKNNGIVYSPSINRLLFPLYMDGDYIGWQGRSLAKDGDVPKYLTTVDSNRLIGNCGLYRSRACQDTGVLVEDVISAIRVSRQVDAIALLGSHPTPEVINWIASRYKNIIIWLDNDKPEVIKQQNKLLSLFKVLVSGRVEIVLTDKDPKDHSDTEIKRLLNL